MALKQLTAGLLAFGIAGTVAALPNGGADAALQQVFDNITVGGPSSVVVGSDYLNDAADSTWALNGSGGSFTRMIIEMAGFAGTNTFGIYGAGTYVELFDGAAAAGDRVTLEINAAGDVFINLSSTSVGNIGSSLFGYYLDSTVGGGDLFHSNSALNTDGLDHMLAYEGTGEIIDVDGAGPIAQGPWGANEYILAFEDLLVSPDWDFTDMVVLVESVTPVPEPGLAALLGAGLVGVGLSRRKNRAA